MYQYQLRLKVSGAIGGIWQCITLHYPSNLIYLTFPPIFSLIMMVYSHHRIATNQRRWRLHASSETCEAMCILLNCCLYYIMGGITHLEESIASPLLLV